MWGVDVELERFRNKVSYGPHCWNWKASTFNTGYGQFTTADGKNRTAHRVAYEYAYGPIPDGLYVCHSCDNRKCVNPAHLWLGNAKANVTDMIDKGRAPRRHANKTSCPAGHEYTVDNLLKRKNGYRECKTCHRLREKMRREQNV